MSADKYERALAELLRRQKEGIGVEDEVNLLDELDHLWSQLTADERRRVDRYTAFHGIEMRD